MCRHWQLRLTGRFAAKNCFVAQSTLNTECFGETVWVYAVNAPVFVQTCWCRQAALKHWQFRGPGKACGSDTVDIDLEHKTIASTKVCAHLAVQLVSRRNQRGWEKISQKFPTCQN